MRKILKIVLSMSLVFLFAFTLTGCDEKNSKNGGNTNGEYQGATEGAGDNLKNVTESNYVKVAKNVFGMDIDTHIGWTLVEAKSPNKVNNLTIDYTVSNGENGKEIIESYFNKALLISQDGVYSYGMNEDYTGMVKKDKYDTFASFAESKLTDLMGLYQTMWIYDYDGKTILFSINVDDDSSGISFTLLG